MVWSILGLKKVEHLAQVLVCLFVVNWLDLTICVLLHLVEVIVQNKLAPDLNDFAEKRFALIYLSLLLKKLTHVKIRTAHAVRLRTEFNTLKINALRQVLKSLFARVGFVLGQEEPTERFMQTSFEPLDVLRRNEIVIRSLFRVV